MLTQLENLVHIAAMTLFTTIMEKTHQCPLCNDVTADLVTEQELLVHKGQSFRIQHTFYRCPVCDLEFDTEETLNDALNQARTIIKSL